MRRLHCDYERRRGVFLSGAGRSGAGAIVETVENLEQDGALSRLQQAFLDYGAIQCGFCTPGMLMSAKALLDKNPHPSEEEIRQALEGNLCRCTGYIPIIEAVKAAAQ